MLKKCYGLFLGLMVIAGSACVTPTHASSASVIITNVKAGSQVSALDEAVVLYNNSSFEVIVSDWCLTNKSQVVFACIEADENEEVAIPAYSYATIVSTVAVSHVDPSAYTVVYVPNNHSSGAIVASTDTVSLIDDEGLLVDQVSWLSSLASSHQWVRTKLSVLPDFYLDTNSVSDWQKLAHINLPVSQAVYRSVVEVPIDPGEPTENPPGPAVPVVTLLPAIITELLPNAAGSDTGNEFIEIYNPNEVGDISLEGYKLAVGLSLEKVIVLAEYILKPGEYKVFTNTELGYTLLNTSSRAAFTTHLGVTGEVLAYSAPAEGEAWALIGDTWQYTNRPTPGTPNLNSILKDNKDQADNPSNTSTPKPCASNQYRSTETGRCRLVSVAASATPTACSVGQERNPETKRCRNIVAPTTASACKEGQEKNPETNRCRAIKKLTTAEFGVKGASTKQQSGMGWYIWAAIGGVVLLIVGYGVWEWRDELKKAIRTIRTKFAGRVK